MRKETEMNEIEIKIPKLDYRTEESYKALRTNLQFCGKEVKVITVTSSMPSEGKSTTTLYLAKALAESNKKVLLIDADLRKSVLMSKCKVGSPVKGLSHVLSGQAPVSSAVCTTNVPNLHVIFAGPVPPNPTELFEKKLLQLILENLSKLYDYILIDTAPLGSVIDAAVIANKCDGSILVVGAGQTSRRVINKVIDQLKISNKPILGVVLNKADLKNSHYGKYYGKYYGKELEKG